MKFHQQNRQFCEFWDFVILGNVEETGSEEVAPPPEEGKILQKEEKKEISIEVEKIPQEEKGNEILVEEGEISHEEKEKEISIEKREISQEKGNEISVEEGEISQEEEEKEIPKKKDHIQEVGLKAQTFLEKQVLGYELLFFFISHYTTSRHELLTKIDNYLKTSFYEGKTAYVSNLKQTDSLTIKQLELHPRRKFLEMLNDGLNLVDAYYYTEFIAYYLFKELIKTINSTGIIGLKYHQDRKGLKSLAANQHPIQRLPPFITLKKDEGFTPIQLLERSSSWSLASLIWLQTVDFKATQAAQQILLRLSQNRGD
jgi:hypothetical protein